jgi:phosphate uptake regulator
MNNKEDPIERKVQLTGGSTYTVSLPKDWAGEQDIEPGSRVNLYSQGDQLVMTQSNSGPSAECYMTSITAGDREPTTVAHSVASAYIAGCDEVRVEGLDTPEQRRAVVRTIRGFIGLEVMSEERDNMIARTMLDAGTLSAEQTLAQIERTALEMHEEAMGAVVEADGEVGRGIARQDDDVDRLFALISRGFQQSLVDPAVTMGNQGELTPFEYYMAARQLERIADHAEKIATIAGRLDAIPPGSTADELLDLGERAREIVERSLSGLLDPRSTGGSVVADAESLLDEIESTDQELYRQGLDDGYLLGLVLDSVERTVEYGINIAEAGLQAEHRGRTSS